MVEESTTPDLLERWRQAADALGRGDFDAGLSCFAPDAVWEVQPRASTGRVQELWSLTVTWRAGMVDRVIGRNDIDEARAAAERLAEGWG